MDEMPTWYFPKQDTKRKETNRIVISALFKLVFALQKAEINHFWSANTNQWSAKSIA
jgi:hypothetical protein